MILATELNPISIISRLVPYILGSGTITVYSPFIQPLVEVLSYMKQDQNYLSPNLSESWMRTYQVLPGRTHPMMTTSATGGYLLHSTRVYVHLSHPCTPCLSLLTLDIPRRSNRELTKDIYDGDREKRIRVKEETRVRRGKSKRKRPNLLLVSMLEQMSHLLLLKRQRT